MSDEALNSIPERQLLEDLDYATFLDEVVKAKQISSGKSPGVDGIPAYSSTEAFT